MRRAPAAPLSVSATRSWLSAATPAMRPSVYASSPLPRLAHEAPNNASCRSLNCCSARNSTVSVSSAKTCESKWLKP